MEVRVTLVVEIQLLKDVVDDPLWVEEGEVDLVVITREIVKKETMLQKRKMNIESPLNATTAKNLVILKDFVGSKKNIQILLKTKEMMELKIYLLLAIQLMNVRNMCGLWIVAAVII